MVEHILIMSFGVDQTDDDRRFCVQYVHILHVVGIRRLVIWAFIPTSTNRRC